MTTLNPIQIQAAAARHGLDPLLVAAIVQTESGGNPWATRFEPGFLAHYVDAAPARFGAVSVETERMGRATSFGPMQIMGQVARERGFTGIFLTELCDPETGLEYGCRHLAALRDRYISQWGLDGVIAAYNAGSPRMAGGRFGNQDYVDTVKRNMGGGHA